jgi:hypothetical protein
VAGDHTDRKTHTQHGIEHRTVEYPFHVKGGKEVPGKDTKEHHEDDKGIKAVIVNRPANV